MGRPLAADSFPRIQAGVSDSLAPGAEAEFERSADGFALEKAGLAALLCLAVEAEGAGGTGVPLSAATGMDGVVREAEARVIAAPSAALEIESGDFELEIGADHMIGFGREKSWR